MAFSVVNLAGAQPIADTSTVQKHPLGQLCRGTDPTYGQGEFIYLLGVANTVVGQLALYNTTTYQTTLTTVTNAKNKGLPVAVAMSANVASQYGWYQIEGLAVIKKTAIIFGPGVPIYLAADATPGRIKALASVGQQVLGAQTANLASVLGSISTVVVSINRPHTHGSAAS